MKIIDLAGRLDALNYELAARSPEDPFDRDHRHALERSDASVRRVKDITTFILSWLGVVAIGGVGAWETLQGHAAAQEWGRALLSSLVGGLAGYVVGKFTK